MKIAFVNQPIHGTTLPPVGSISIWTYEVARRLAASNQVLVYGRRFAGQARQEIHDGVTYRRLWTAADQWLNLFLQPASRACSPRRPLFASPLFFPEYALKVAIDLRRRQFDVVHVQNFSQMVPIIRALNPDIRIVLHMHCEWLTQLDRKIIEPRLACTDAIVSCCDYLTNRTREAFPRFSDRCCTLHNGVDVNHFVKPDGEGAGNGTVARSIVYIGRISPEKGVHVLLEAFERVIESRPHVELVLIGPDHVQPEQFYVSICDDPKVKRLSRLCAGSYRSFLQQRLSPRAAEQVHFVPYVAHDHVVQYLRRADIFVQPSIWAEPFPLAVLEALATGVPVVASSTGGLVECIGNGETGLLVEPDNAPELAGAILQLLADDCARRRMGVMARRRAAEEFSWEHTVQRLGTIYGEIVSRSSRVSRSDR